MNNINSETIWSPFDGSPVGLMPIADENDVEAATVASVEAFGVMKALPRFVRADILDRAAQIIKRRRAEFASTIASEAGKPLFDARGEVSRAIFNLTNAAAEARRFVGEEVPLDVDGGVHEYQVTGTDGHRIDIEKAQLQELKASRQRVGIARRFPIGPILAIAPFNFPLNLVLHKVAPAIAVGNSVVLKPAPQTPLTSALLLQVFEEAGLPQGALQVVHCSVALAEKMVRDDRFAMVTFTGSAKVGWHIKSISGRKKVALELGGNGAVIVCDDADVDLAVARCARGGLVYAGQYCIGVQRILVARQIYDVFCEKLIAKVRSFNVGDPLVEGVDVGPVINEDAAKRISAWTEEALANGAKLLCGGTRNGTLLQPTLLSNTTPSMKVECEEVFGPVMTVNPFDNFDDALNRAASGNYGLQGGLFTNNLRRAFQSIEEWDVGGLIVNDVPIFRIDNMPFGGWKQSGLGREGTRYAMEEMSAIKHLVLNYS
ncbi:aldehyde dehydrogenase family protein [Mesorhizobium caraganae]|uniref:aldehyde dehydrogenase family protein n=1 Tax=Mesorhizobium caraganae TaxID=483206 RepID=UPI0028A08CE9|nr:aldehyde dehydrogenase family protein [Mesorhizobium caraganae]